MACFDFSVRDPNFFVEISFYDSLERGAQKRIQGSSALNVIVRMVNLF